MKANVKLNEDGERYRIEVSEQGGMTATFNLDGDTAELTQITPNNGDAEVYGEQITRPMDYVEGFDGRRGRVIGLADGIEVLEDEDQVFESLVNSITKQHSSVTTEASTREFFRLFREEVETFTESLVDEEDQAETEDLQDLVVDDRGEA